MARFVHTADWQLGMTRHFLDSEAQPRFSEARIEAVRAIGRLAAAQGCDFVVVCGDVFETNFVDRQVVIRALDAMAETPDVRFYLLPGNHDPLDASCVFDSRQFLDHAPSNVVVLRDSEPVRDPSGVELVAAPWRSKRPLEDLVAAALRDLPADGSHRIAVGHGALDALSPDPGDPAVVSLAEAEQAVTEGRVAYVALGDRHSTTDVGSTGRVRYSGAPEPTDYDELDPGNVLVVDLDGDAVAAVAHSVGTWRFVQEHFEVTSQADCDEVVGFLDSLPDKSRTIVKLSLVGQLSLSVHAGFERALEDRSALLGALEIWERRSDLVTLPDEDDLGDLGLSGYALDATEDLRSAAQDTDEPARAAIAGEALRLLYRLASHDTARGGGS